MVTDIKIKHGCVYSELTEEEMQKRRAAMTRKNFESRKVDRLEMKGKSFKVIPGFSGYLISEDGEVYSIWKNRIMRQSLAGPNRNYAQVSLIGDDGKQRFSKVHRLVAIVYLEKPDGKDYVNHKDENPSNNHVSNLEWCTHQYNDTYGTKIERQVATLKANYELTAKHILSYSKDGTLIKEYPYLERVSEDGYLPCVISRASRGLRKTAYGLVWKVKEEQKNAVS